MPPAAPTITEVARAARTSTGTVSRVLNGRPGVAPNTRKRVLEAIESLGYTPDAAARALAFAGRAAPVLALPAPGHLMASPFYALLRRATLRAAAERGWRIVETDGVEGVGTFVDGVVLMWDDLPARALERLETRGRKVVLVGRHERLDWVCIDDAVGMAAATRPLLDAGHSDIWHLGLSGGVSSMGPERAHGYRAALAERGLPPQVLGLEPGGFALGGYRAVTRAWSRGVRFTALACVCDEAALGATYALQDLGVRVPQDVSVVGFDGLPNLPLPLTTVRQDFGQIAATVLDQLLHRLHQPTSPPSRSLLAPTLVSGPSVAPVA